MEEKRTKLQIGSLIALGAVAVVFFAVYLMMSLRLEVRFDRETFTAKEEGGSTVLTGFLGREKGTVTVTPQEGGAAFAFHFPPGFQQEFWVGLGDPQVIQYRGGDNVAPIEVRPVTVTGEGGALLLDAYYWPDSFVPLVSKEGEDLYNDYLDITVETSVYHWDWDDYQLPLADMARMAAGDLAPAHREVAWSAFVLFTILGGISALEVAFPLTCFRLAHFLSVQDPEPTDFALAMMRITWGTAPFLLALCYAIGLSW